MREYLYQVPTKLKLLFYFYECIHRLHLFKKYAAKASCYAITKKNDSKSFKKLYYRILIVLVLLLNLGHDEDSTEEFLKKKQY